jgi:hypothetical protein
MRTYLSAGCKSRIKSNMKNYLFMATVMLLVVSQAAPLQAKKISPDQVKISTPIYTPELSHFNPPLGRYTYAVTWNGIPAGTVEVDLNRNGGDYEIKATVYTTKAIDYVYKLRYRTMAVVSAETLMPRRSFSFSRANSREKRIEMEFMPNGEIHSEYTDPYGKLESLYFDPDNFTLDPYSAGFMALSMEWEVGDKRQFDTFNGINRYLIELTAVDRTEITANGKICQAIVISPKVKKLTDTDTGKLRETRIYISAGDSREILKISSDLFIGSMDTDMVSFTPADTCSSVPARVVKPNFNPTSESLIPIAAKQNAGIHEIY